MTAGTHWPRLLKCPFCGGSANARSVGDKGYFRVSCSAAMTCGHSGSAMPSLETAAEAWNRRAPSNPSEEVEPPIHWRCFHCDFIARDRLTALEHFGPGINERPPLCQSSTSGYARDLSKNPLEPKLQWDDASPAPASAGVEEFPLPAVDAAAKKLAEVMDYPWAHMPEKGRAQMRENAKAVLRSYSASLGLQARTEGKV